MHNANNRVGRFRHLRFVFDRLVHEQEAKVVKQVDKDETTAGFGIRAEKKVDISQLDG